MTHQQFAFKTEAVTRVPATEVGENVARAYPDQQAAFFRGLVDTVRHSAEVLGNITLWNWHCKGIAGSSKLLRREDKVYLANMLEELTECLREETA